MAWAPDYVTTAEARAFVTRHSETADDADLALAVTASSRAIDREANRQFGLVAAPEERFYPVRWDRRRCRWVVEIDDLMTQTGLVVAVTAGTLTAFTVEPRNAAAKGKPWELLVIDADSPIQPVGNEYEAAITARWGWSAVPTPIKQAALLQANRLFSRRESPHGIAGSPEIGSELRLLARLDPDVAVTIGPYKRWWAAA